MQPEFIETYPRYSPAYLHPGYVQVMTTHCPVTFNVLWRSLCTVKEILLVLYLEKPKGLHYIDEVEESSHMEF